MNPVLADPACLVLMDSKSDYISCRASIGSLVDEIGSYKNCRSKFLNKMNQRFKQDVLNYINCIEEKKNKVTINCDFRFPPEWDNRYTGYISPYKYWIKDCERDTNPDNDLSKDSCLDGAKNFLKKVTYELQEIYKSDVSDADEAISNIFRKFNCYAGGEKTCF